MERILDERAQRRTVAEILLDTGSLSVREIVRRARARGMSKAQLLKRLRRRGHAKLAWKIQNFNEICDMSVGELLAIYDELESAPIPMPPHVDAAIGRVLRALEDWEQNTKILGRLIAERRKRLGWTQSELAARAGMSRETLSQLERGQLKGRRKRYNSDKYRQQYEDKIKRIDAAFQNAISREF